ncbi:MAG: hypothetical protein A2079_03760 [Geobacteraceae bacterium GWC2_48_7]|nr:MAG: hypothetical protein A2079_03760 [Geobacteraceae bacterium GWC2_48_7]
MTHFETSRVNELIGLQIGKIRELANLLNPNLDIQEIESRLAEVEVAVAELRNSLSALPHAVA